MSDSARGNNVGDLCARLAWQFKGPGGGMDGPGAHVFNPVMRAQGETLSLLILSLSTLVLISSFSTLPFKSR